MRHYVDKIFARYSHMKRFAQSKHFSR